VQSRPPPNIPATRAPPRPLPLRNGMTVGAHVARHRRRRLTAP